ncbi:type I 3-dehydroquinate dehydratase [Candidatus Roizmanbacteria bacterium RIFCSPHIGHO2_01_FULL_39_8]|uniref:3-dehydroquinate dehydratase n=2 Tax=Candidatus Roizmaniibacteriota TaxID=1752723 RepID=A0A1F7GKF6_9BACT|nr:MAG: type I 3-dehydroquinate dehydratase [Candidatus Roizmanbacteria bacterium RIFCSPHIGHO2_01_FULL_39_8]OGK26232.1 MAG: type I 3-dehydroquinate dehydratase [Candidatus Roizmanbacteria bacterium RIFCSPHIGHO2_02_FULL_39_9]
MQKIRICTVVTGKYLDEFIGNLKNIQTESDLVELRVDHILNLKLKDLEIIRNQTKKESIFTCRIKKEGGLFLHDESLRKKILQKGFELEFDHIDIELSTFVKWQPIRNKKTKLIISYHNLEKTPHFWILNKIIFQMNQFLPNILKIATMVTDDYDMTQLYRIMVNKPKKEERIVVGMGEKGKITRILGPLLGSYLTYASTPLSQSAPGQMDIGKLKVIYDSLNLEDKIK